MKTEPNDSSFLTSLSFELTARSNRIRFLIGDAHWASDGYHNENVVRDFLCRYSPKSIEVSRGFIRTVQPNGVLKVSPEVDILLTDAMDHVPLFSGGDLKIVEPDSVRAYFEVKSTFSRAKLREALDHIQQVQTSFTDENTRSQVWRCVFFNSSGGHKSPSKVVFEEAQKVAQGQKARDTFLPNCIVVNGASITFITPTRSSISYFPRISI